MPDRRFVILCLPRTGSSHLVELLDSHPAIRCFGELYNPRHPDAAGGEGWFGHSRSTDPREHLAALFAGRPERAVGFKLPIAQLDEQPALGELLEEEPDIRIVRLVRRNPLAMLVSQRLLRATLVSQSRYGSYGDATVAIAPRECLRALERMERDDARLDRLAAGHPHHRIGYEDLAAGRGLDELQRFLGIERASLSSDLERLRRRSLSETVDNWPELVEALRGTRFERCLDEEPPERP
jgi:hypothetical protein